MKFDAPLDWVWWLRPFIQRRVPFLAPRITRLRQHEPKALRLPAPRRPSPGRCLSITVVTPSFGQGLFIERTIRSLLDQHYPELEYVVVDGGSQDGTVGVLKRYRDRLARYLSERDEGQADAINKGFDGTTGAVMAYLNSDDLLLPGALVAVSEFFRARPDVDVVYGHRILIDENDHEIGRWILPSHDSEVLKWMDWVPQETLFWRRRAWESVGGRVDPTFKFALDWDLLLRFERAGLKIERMNRFVGAFRVHARQKTTAQMLEHGAREMRLLRRRSLGRNVSESEIRRAVFGYLLRHWLADTLWRLGLSDLES
jgi:glycosyltransferase involved in cell wall biosynthesis